MLTDNEIKAIAYKYADGEAGKRNFNADMSWVVAYTRAVEAAQRERCAVIAETSHPHDWAFIGAAIRNDGA